MRARKPRIFDQRGRYLGDAPADGTVTPPAPGSIDDTLGGSIWDLLHPFTVQDEYAAVGQPPPPVSDIIGQAATNIETHAADAVASVADVGKWVMVAAVGLGILYVITQFHKAHQ